MKPIIITTEHRGVFFGYVEDDTNLKEKTQSLKDARMAIRWRTTKGIAELAETGPNDESIIGSKADVPVIHNVTAVFFVSKEAEEKWIKA